MKTVKFKGFTGDLQKGHYGNGRIAYELIDHKDGDPIASVTINIPEEDLKDDEVIIKNYSENEGMLQVLMKAGVVSAPLRFIQSGFITAPVCRLLI